MELPEPDEDAMVRVAVSHLADRFPGTARSRIEAIVRRCVSTWNRRARLKSFVGVIAERHARRELERSEGEAV
jgi:hypothetical protein